MLATISRLRAFENRVLWRMLGPKQETAGDKTKGRLEQLLDVYTSLSVSMVKIGGAWHSGKRGEMHLKI
jgi:hypothetical protein